MILADMGADVIKIEAPGRGDDFRQYPPLHGDLQHGAPFLWTNRNKRSVAIDLKVPRGQEIVRELIAKADVIVENFSTGVMQRFGLDYDSCREIKPDIIYCSVSAYGRDGASADRLGFDPVAQAESGFVSMNGYSDREGVRALSPVMDISTAMMACNAILGALVARERNGIGQAIEVSLFDNAVLMTGYATLQHLFSGTNPQRSGNTSPDTCPSGVFQAQDRAFYINCGNDKIFQRLMSQVIGRDDLCRRRHLRDRAGSNPSERRAVRDARRSVCAATVVVLATSHAGRGRTLRRSSDRGRSDSLAGSHGTRACNPYSPSQTGLGPERHTADTLLPHPGRGSGCRAVRGATYRRSVARATGL